MHISSRTLHMVHTNSVDVIPHSNTRNTNLMARDQFLRRYKSVESHRLKYRAHLSSWHSFGIHDVSLDNLAAFSERTLEILPQRCFAAATRTDDDHAHSLTQLLIEFERFPNLKTAHYLDETKRDALDGIFQ